MDSLLTGATGALGAQLLQDLVEARPRDSIYVLIRAKDPEDLRRRSKELGALRDSVVPVLGDSAQHDLGLGSRYLELAERVGEIYHAAACTRLEQTYAHAERQNVQGTRNVLDFARAATRFGGSGRLHYVSTAYVAGRRTGCVLEDELECGQDFSNAYEWSKFEAECAVRLAAAELPVTIYRPGVVIGHSRTGAIRRFSGVYQVLRWIERGVLDTLPCRSEFLFDAMPVDYVAGAIVRLAGTPASIGKTFQLTSGAANSPRISEFIEGFLGRLPVGLRFSEDAPCSPQMRHYLPYLTCEKWFDSQNARTLLTGFGVPSWRDYLPNVARYVFQSRISLRANGPSCLPPTPQPAMASAQS